MPPAQIAIAHAGPSPSSTAASARRNARASLSLAALYLLISTARLVAPERVEAPATAAARLGDAEEAAADVVTAPRAIELAGALSLREIYRRSLLRTDGSAALATRAEAPPPIGSAVAGHAHRGGSARRRARRSAGGSGDALDGDARPARRVAPRGVDARNVASPLGARWFRTVARGARAGLPGVVGRSRESQPPVFGDARSRAAARRLA